MSTRFNGTYYLTPSRAALTYAAAALPDSQHAVQEIARVRMPHGDVTSYAAELEAYMHLEETSGGETREVPEVDGFPMSEKEWRRYCRAAIAERIHAATREMKENPRAIDAERVGETNPGRSA